MNLVETRNTLSIQTDNDGNGYGTICLCWWRYSILCAWSICTGNYGIDCMQCTSYRCLSQLKWLFGIECAMANKSISLRVSKLQYALSPGSTRSLVPFGVDCWSIWGDKKPTKILYSLRSVYLMLLSFDMWRWRIHLAQSTSFNVLMCTYALKP